MMFDVTKKKIKKKNIIIPAIELTADIILSVLKREKVLIRNYRLRSGSGTNPWMCVSRVNCVRADSHMVNCIQSFTVESMK